MSRRRREREEKPLPRPGRSQYTAPIQRCFVRDGILQDVRYALRHLRRAPGFSLVAILTLALGVGANTALFSLLNAVVLRPLPIKEPQRFVVVSRVNQRGQSRNIPLVTVAELARDHRSLETLAGYSCCGMFTTDANGVLSASPVEFVDQQYYPMLGVRPFLGRLISTEDAPQATDSVPVVVLGYGFWQRQFGGHPRAVGQTLRVAGVALTIIGVTPPGFSGLQVDVAPDITVPITLYPRLASTAPDPKRPLQGNYAIGKLRQNATLDHVRAELGALWPSIREASVPPGYSPSEQDEFRSSHVRVESIATGFSSLRDRYSKSLTMLVGLTGLLLMVACVNLSGLLLARAAARDHELAVRMALGASRGRLAQGLLVESLLLSVGGTAVALPLAWWTSKALGRMMYTGVLSLTVPLTPDWRVLSLAAAAAIGTGVVIGAMPAWAAGRRDPRVGLQQARPIAHTTDRWAKALLVAQVAISLVLLLCAGLLTRSLANLRALDAGFHAKGMVLARLSQQPDGYRNLDEATYYPELVERLSTLPGVRSVSLSRLFAQVVNETALLQPVALAEVVSGSVDVGALMDAVSPRFFETVGIPLLDGRDFTWRDDSRSPAVVIVNSSLARSLFPSRNAIGQRIRVGTDPKLRALEIVGVVGDASFGSLRASHVPVVFRSWLQSGAYARYPIVEVRTGVAPKSLGDEVRRAAASLGREYVLNLRTPEDQLSASLARERVTAALSSFFAGLAILLAAIGLYGFLAYDVARRTREIGVCMALGASRPMVLRMVVWQGLVLTSLGIAIGVPCALAVGRLTGALLFDLAPSDPVTLTGAAGFLTIVGTVAALVPAVRASSVDPMVAVRSE